MGIEIEDLGRRYGDRWVLRDMSLSVKPGEVVGLLGPNGAGKSTTMKILTGILSPSAGRAIVNGTDVTDLRPAWRKGIGYLPEHNPLYPDLYVREYLMHVARIYRLESPGKEVNRAIELTGLAPEQHQKIGLLSKGYRQRVGLAAALLHNPEVLVLDEPTSGLDPNQIVEIRQVIREVGATKAILLSSHIMQEVEATCDRVAIMNHGKLVAEGRTADVMGSAAGNAVVVAFAGEITKEQIEGWFPGKRVESLPGSEWAIRGVDSMEARLLLFRKAVEMDVPLVTLYERRSHLEDVFHALTADGAEPDSKVES